MNEEALQKTVRAPTWQLHPLRAHPFLPLALACLVVFLRPFTVHQLQIPHAFCYELAHTELVLHLVHFYQQLLLHRQTELFFLLFSLNKSRFLLFSRLLLLFRGLHPFFKLLLCLCECALITLCHFIVFFFLLSAHVFYHYFSIKSVEICVN